MRTAVIFIQSMYISYDMVCSIEVYYNNRCAFHVHKRYETNGERRGKLQRVEAETPPCFLRKYTTDKVANVRQIGSTGDNYTIQHTAYSVHQVLPRPDGHILDLLILLHSALCNKMSCFKYILRTTKSSASDVFHHSDSVMLHNDIRSYLYRKHR